MKSSVALQIGAGLVKWPKNVVWKTQPAQVAFELTGSFEFDGRDWHCLTHDECDCVVLREDDGSTHGETVP